MKFLLFFLGTLPCFATMQEQIYPTCADEIIAQETGCIAAIHPSDYCGLAEKYCARGESYLLLNRYAEALEDFQMAYDLTDKVTFFEGYKTLLRSLLGQLLTYGNLDNEEMTSLVRNEILAVLSVADQQPVVLVKNQGASISGPNDISIEECKYRVSATKANAYELFQGKKLKSSIVQACENVIDILALQAERCCDRGSPWKICLQPLLNKWLDWFQNGIPKKVKDITLD